MLGEADTPFNYLDTKVITQAMVNWLKMIGLGDIGGTNILHKVKA